MEFEFEVPTWNQIYSMILNLAERIDRSNFEPEIILGVSRGGWIPARVLSDLLCNPNLANARAEFYSGIAETEGEPTLTQSVSMSVGGRKVLIVDEVVDSGKTLKLIKDHVIEQGAKEVKTAAIYIKPWSTVKPDYYEKETTHWIVFPWEIKETLRKIIEKHIGKERFDKEEIAKFVKSGLPAELVERFVKEILEEEKC